MTLVHAPTLVSLSIGFMLTLIDLYLKLQFALAEECADMARLFADPLFPADALLTLERSGFLVFRRDAAGRIVGIADSQFPDAFTKTLDLALRDQSARHCGAD